MFIFLLRRLGPRGRTISGLALVVVGLALIAVPGMLIHGIAVAVIGAVLVASVGVSRRRSARLAREQAAREPVSQNVPAPAAR